MVPIRKELIQQHGWATTHYPHRFMYKIYESNDISFRINSSLVNRVLAMRIVRRDIADGIRGETDS